MMPDAAAYAAFIVASAILVMIPGPNVMVIVATSSVYGSGRGLQTVLGTTTAMLIQLAAAAAGTAWIIDAISQGLSWLQWLGIAYLFYLGAGHMLQSGRETTAVPAAGQYFRRGFLVSLFNPKTILFFSAYLPQFVSTGQYYAYQIAALSVTFVLIAAIIDSAYALMAGRLACRLQQYSRKPLHHVAAGLMYWLAGLWLLDRNPD